MALEFKPADYYVIVKPTKARTANNTKTDYGNSMHMGNGGGYGMSTENKESKRVAQTGTIEGLGKSAKDKGYKKGDKVFFLEGCGSDFEISGKTFLKIYIDDLLGGM